MDLEPAMQAPDGAPNSSPAKSDLRQPACDRGSVSKRWCSASAQILGLLVARGRPINHPPAFSTASLDVEGMEDDGGKREALTHQWRILEV